MGGIDAVITWVDGGQPEHRRQLESHLSVSGRQGDEAAHSTRFHHAGEIDYCVASIRRYAPWFRHIYIVTNGQVPGLLGRLAGTGWEQRVKLVEHRQIFAGYEQYLPTFNSRSIISMLWRIEGLSERFVLFNDDFMLLRPLDPEDFFRGETVLLRGRWRMQSGLGGLRRHRDDGTRAKADARRAQELSASIVGYRWRYLRLSHAPYGLRKTLLQDFFERHPERLHANIQHRLRSPAQFKTEVLLAHLALRQGQACVDRRLRVAQLNVLERDRLHLRARMRQADRSRAIAFACVQSLDQASPELREEIFGWLARRIGPADARACGNDSPALVLPGLVA